MSSNLLDRFGRTISFRLNLWYAAIFTVSSCVLFLVLYFLLAVAIEWKDQEVIEAKIKEYSTVYEAGGLAALQNRVGRPRTLTSRKAFCALGEPLPRRPAPLGPARLGGI